jgi:hypothetical protein
MLAWGMAILNPITDSAVLALDPALEGEQRIQSLMALWYANYFTGLAFTTRAAGGGTMQKVFAACDFQWQEDEMPENPQKPILHTVFHDGRRQRMDMAAGVYGHDDRWMLDVYVKVPSNLSGTPMKGKNPEHVARRVAGQVEWLFSSSEREALSVCGVLELRVENPPTILPGTSWHMRMMVASCLTRREQAR